MSPEVFGIRIEFILFAIVLICVVILHKHTFWVGLAGLVIILFYKIFFTEHFNFSEHFFGTCPLVEQICNKETRTGEWGILVNLAGLIIGFSLLAKIFEESLIPDILPDYLPDDWKGPFVLLLIIFILSTFLDNIAAAMIGGSIALVVFRQKVHLGYIVAIVAASNAGGAGSVLGDTTTTMMWISGVSPVNVLHAFIASSSAFIFFAVFASIQQDKFQRISKDALKHEKIDKTKVVIVILILAGAIITNITYDMPALGVWIAIFISALFSKLPWKELNNTFKGTIFLLCLVICASLMPVQTLPDASWVVAFILGFVSSVFDNIPLTKLCIDQGHYDWGMLAYAVGFGGSMIWFGSSAGIAITNKFPNSRNVLTWIKNGWHVIVAYLIGFFLLYLIIGWHPTKNNLHDEPAKNCKFENCNARINAITNENN